MSVGVFFATLSVSESSDTAMSRNPDYNVYKFPEPARLVIVGDIHGDLAQLKAILQLSDVIDKDGNWKPLQQQQKSKSDCEQEPSVILPPVTVNKQQHLLFMGDLVDRGPDDKAVLEEIQKWQQQAMAHGDLVTVLLGNHEIMNLQGHYHYVHEASHEAFGGKRARTRALGVGKPLGDFIRTFPIAVSVFDSIFVHAGLSLQVTREYFPYTTTTLEEALATMNKEARHALKTGNFAAKIFGTEGPIWTRDLMYKGVGGNCEELQRVLKRTNQSRMIVGHTPQRSGRITPYCQQQLLGVDVGLSKWMYSHLAALEITRNKVTGEVELQEILPNTAVEEKPTAAAEKSNGDKNAEGIESMDEALVKDPILLAELLEAARDLEQKESKRAKKSTLGEA